jgi:hypothetical protein
MRAQRLFWVFLLMSAIWVALTAWEASEYMRPTCPARGVPGHWTCALERPIAELTLAASPAELKAGIDRGSPGQFESWNLAITRVHACMDLITLGLFWAAFLLFALQCARSWLPRAVIGAASGAALLGLVKDVLLLRAVGAMRHGAAFAFTPRVASIGSWLLLAMATALAGILLVRMAGTWRRMLGILLFATAAVTIGGLWWTPLLMIAAVLAAVALLIALILYMPLHPWTWKAALQWVEFFYLIRFQIIGGLVLTIVLPAGYFAAPSIFAGLYDAQTFLSFAFVAYAALELALIVMITSRLTLVYGPIRFAGIQTLRPANQMTWTTTGMFCLLALPVIAMACSGTTAMSWWQKTLGIVAAALLSLGVLWLIAKLHYYIERDPGYAARMVFPAFPRLATTSLPQWSGAGWLHRMFLGLLPDRLSRGVVRSEADLDLEGGGSAGSLLSGHHLAVMALLVQVVTYCAIGVLSAPAAGGSRLYRLLTPLSEHQPAAMFYILFLLGIVTWFCSGAAFILDIVRVPVLTTTLAVSLLFGLLGTDHIFKVYGGGGHAPPPTPSAALGAWQRSRGGVGKPVVIVATAGGGIRAAAWTAEVLTRLTEECAAGAEENRFASSLVLVSAVSGGSEGAMYFDGTYGEDGRVASTLGDVRADAYHSSLSSVGWGLLYPDLLRIVPVVGSIATPLFGNAVDRGWALEQDWIRNWTGRRWTTPPTIEEWSDDTAKGKRPALIINATASESGQRFLMATTALPPDPRFEHGYLPAIQFEESFPGMDMPIATAARLSASFAWVSPMARASAGDERVRMHVADGGYYDNSGVVSALEWLMAAGDALKGHPVFVVLVDSTPGWPAGGESWTWQRQLVAPMGTLQSVRTSSQQARAQFELQLATDDLSSRGIQVKQVRLRYPSDLLTPLSWHLTPDQQKNIDEAWSKPGAELAAQRDVLLQGLGCPVK